MLGVTDLTVAVASRISIYVGLAATPPTAVIASLLVAVDLGWNTFKIGHAAYTIATEC